MSDELAFRQIPFKWNSHATVPVSFEPPRGETNNVVSEQVRHKPSCTVTDAG